MDFKRNKKLNKTASHKVEDSFFGIAANLYKDANSVVTAGHIALIICVDDEIQSFHWNNGQINIHKPAEDHFWNAYFQNGLDLWEEESELDYLMAWFERIKTKSVIKFGYHFDMSTFNADGSSSNLGNTSHITTCVGFALRVLNSIVPSRPIVEVESWPLRSLSDPYEAYRFQVLEAQGEDMTAYLKNYRRIFPKEGLMISYISPSDYPVKHDTIKDWNDDFQKMMESVYQ